ncbi:MAG: L,D-transpeptidase [Clostridia bacterium]|nr:L,D-transpeptidase [Clostridia bacterium]
MKELLKNDEKRELILCGLGILLTVIAVITLFVVAKNKNQYKSKSISVVSKSVNIEDNKENGEQEEILVVVIEKSEEQQPLDAPENAKEIEEENKKSTETVTQEGYYIKVNNLANVVTVYSVDAGGNMTPIKAMTCSTGTATPGSGVYSVKTKWTWGYLFGNVWGHYVTKIVGNILFHSVPYLSSDPSTLEYWEYDKLGTSASMGCVRLSVADAKWIFENMPYGTPVEFYADSNPGPLGKPGTRKISGNVQCRDWDPTDPDPNNPWFNVVDQEVSNSQTEQQQETPQPQPSQQQDQPKQEEQNKQENNQQEEPKQEEPEDNTTESDTKPGDSNSTETTQDNTQSIENNSDLNTENENNNENNNE